MKQSTQKGGVTCFGNLINYTNIFYHYKLYFTIINAILTFVSGRAFSRNQKSISLGGRQGN